MRYAVVLRSVVVVFVLALVGLVGPVRAGARQATPVVAQPGAHSLVGAWLLDSDPAPDNVLSLSVFHADGTYTEFDPEDGSAGAGAWVSTGDNTAILTIVFLEAADDGSAAGQATVRATIEVAADGQSFTASYTLEFIDPDGTSTGEYGPVDATATRIVAEAPGEPVGTLDDLSSQFEEDEGTPES
jgi:hypothetical protein